MKGQPGHIGEQLEEDARFQPVREAESGQKVLRFLQRRLNLPESLLHRWLRTGQIRLNGRRCKPFERIAAGDVLRVPPFAGRLAREARLNAGLAAPGGEASARPGQAGCQSLDFLPPCGDVWAINKPAGLAAHPGSGHELDSVSSRLASAFPGSPFRPAPAHRLDRDTSGVLLVGATFQALRGLQDNLRQGLIHKEYLAWVRGEWPGPGTVCLRHFLRRDYRPGMPSMSVCARDAPNAREAACIVRPLRVEKMRSLLQIRLLTGRRHQIRVQLAALGHAVLGDSRYGGAVKGGILRLHSLRAVLPSGHEFVVLPPWPGEWAVSCAPRPLSAGFPAG